MSNGKRASIEINYDSKLSPDMRRAILHTDRKKIVFGRRVHTLSNGNYKLGDIVYHRPYPYKNQEESIYLKGMPGSGKTWGGYSIAGQTFFGEARTWIFIDTKGSYIGNNRPNLKQKNNLRLFNARPQGIPGNLIKIIAPKYYLEAASPREIDDSLVTDYYTIPLRFICKNVLTLFELVKANKSAQYSAELDERFKQLLIYTNNKPTLDDIYEMINEIVENPDYSRVRNVYTGMMGKIRNLAKYTIDENAQWSAIGQALFDTVRQSQIAGYKIPSWIIFTLALSEHPEEEKNLAFISTLLTEIYAFAKYARMNNLPISLGIFLDELHTWVRDAKSSARLSIHDLFFAFGRSFQIKRCFATQNDDQLDKVFKDDISKISDIGRYSVVAEYTLRPEPGYAAYLNRLDHNPLQHDQPLFVPKLKTCPPLMCVESDQPNDLKWIEEMTREMVKNNYGQKKDKYRNFMPKIDNRLGFDYNQLKAL